MESYGHKTPRPQGQTPLPSTETLSQEGWGFKFSRPSTNIQNFFSESGLTAVVTIDDGQIPGAPPRVWNVAEDEERFSVVA